jgi:Uma2 family endonuclease
MAAYPDVSVVCGPIEAAPDDPHAVTNPSLIVEVTSDGTEAYDRGEKFEHYRQIPTLQVYALVSHRRRRVETRRRITNGPWTEDHAGRGGVVRLEAIGIEVTVDEIYDRSPLTISL